MKQLNFNAQTGETTIIEVPDIEIQTIEQTIDIKAQAIAEIESATTVSALKSAMLKFIEAS